MNQPRRPEWEMKGGEKIFMDQMTDSHLINAANSLSRNESAIEQSIIQSAEQVWLMLGADTHAEYEVEKFIDAAREGDIEPFDVMHYEPMKDLIAEIKRRNLSKDDLDVCIQFSSLLRNWEPLKEISQLWK